MTDYNEYKEIIGEWSENQFGDQPAINPLMGVDEERGESLTRFILKSRQGIRQEELDEVDLDEELADIMIYLADYAYRKGYDLESWEAYTFNDDLELWRECLLSYADLVHADHERDDQETQLMLTNFVTKIEGVGKFFMINLETATLERSKEIIQREWDSDYKQ